MEEGEDPEARLAESCHRLYLFLRYVTVVKPELAREVKTTDLPLLHGPGRDDEIAFTDRERTVYRHLIAYAMGLAPDSRFINPAHVRELREARPSATIWLLVAACRRLERLRVSQTDGDLLKHVMDLAVVPAGNNEDGQEQRRLALLKEFSLDCPYFQEDVSVVMRHRIFFDIFRLPSLKSVKLVNASLEEVWQYAADADYGELFRQRVPTGSSGVEHIHIRDVLLTPALMRHLAQAPRSLKSLHIVDTSNGVQEAEVAMPRDLMEGIVSQAETLESLHAEFQDPVEYLEFGDLSWMTSERAYMGTALKEMTALRRLVASMGALTGLLEDEEEVEESGESEAAFAQVGDPPALIECLPENLEYLEIRSCTGTILDEAQKFLNEISSGTRLTKLRRVVFSFLAWAITPEEFTLTCDAPNVSLEIAFQDLV